MRGRIITAVAVGLGLFAAAPTFAADRGHEQVAQNRTVTHETRTVTHENRPVQIDRHDARPVVRDGHVNVVRENRRDVHVDEHMTIDNRRSDFDHHWDRDRVRFVPEPIVTIPVAVPIAVSTDCDTPIAVNQVPAIVLNAIAQQTGGAPIVSVDYVRQGAGIFYDVRMNGPYNVLQTLRFGANGGFCGYL